MKKYTGFNSENSIRINNEYVNDHDSILYFSNFPVFIGCVDSPKEEDIFSPMDWVLSKKALTVRPLIDSTLVYLENHNDSVGQTWRDHHKRFAKFLLKNLKGNSVYEIGGAHGLLSVYAHEDQDVDWLIHDINPQVIDGYRGKVISGKFLKNKELSLEYSTIAHSHTLEHVNDPIDFMNQIVASQNIGDHLIFSVPNMDEMLNRVDLNFIGFEHNYYLSENFIVDMLSAFNYEIIDRERFRDHSLFFAARFNGYDGKFIPNIEINNYEEVKEKINLYIENCQNKVNTLNKIVDNFDGEVFLFGSHIFSLLLIAFGLKTDKIKYCLDNSKQKRGKRLYGTDLVSYLPEDMLKDKSKQLVIGSLASYRKEVEKQIIQLNSDIKFYLK